MTANAFNSAALRRLANGFGSVTAFAQAVPVSRRMATYWLSDPKRWLHPKWHARLREMQHELAKQRER